MMQNDRLGLWLIGIVVAGLIIVFAAQIAASSRLRRRRRKNHGPIVSKHKGPTVRLTVKPPKE